MECNRDEAIRAKVIAEKKFADKDFTGAKKFTLKAQTLNPDLDGISHMLITINVYISSESKINGESDWYGILDVNPTDDDETIRKQYRKLVLMLHPDKNKSVGADGAFKILLEAWSLLSDKSKRTAYDQRRNAKVFNGVHSCSNKPTSKPKRCNINTNTTTFSQKHPPSGPYPNRVPFGAPYPTMHRLDTFWTICHRCKMHYEYVKVHLNTTILCPNCHKPFLAAEMAAPVNFLKAAQPSGDRWHQSPSYSYYASKSKTNGNMYNNCGNTGPSAASKAANIVHQVKTRLRKECEGFHAQQPLKKRKD